MKSSLSLSNKHCRGLAWARAAGLFTLLIAPLSAADTYLVHNLVADLPGAADRVDKNLVNPWGIGFSATSPFWIGNNHSGTSTIYDGSGAAIPLVVNVPAAGGGQRTGNVTGVVFNDSQSFPAAPGKPSTFLFCTEDGTISGWNSAVDQTHATILIDNSASGAVYKGCTLAGPAAAPILYAANFRSGAIDAWGGDLKPLAARAFQDTQIPAGFAPFNIQSLNGKLHVTYAKQGQDKTDDLPGNGNGYVAVFDLDGQLLTHLISQGSLNSPWGLAIAPANFGNFSGALLVGNFGDGAIHAFDVNTGALLGALSDTFGKAIGISGLWALTFGNGGRGGDPATLYFTAGTAGTNGDPIESHGLFGSIQAAPFFQDTDVTNAASFSGTLAANTWATIRGGALSPKTRSWTDADFTGGRLPTQLDGVSVTINGEAAYVSFISPMQINFLIPADLQPGPANVQVTNNGMTSGSIKVTLQAAAPAFFVLGATKYIAATRADGVTLIGPTGLIAGLTTTPVKAGETAVLYATGLGATTPATPNGQVVTSPLPAAALPRVTIGNLPAQVQFAGLVSPGLYQINALVPAIAGGPDAVDAAVVAQVGGVSSQPNAFLSVTPAPAAPQNTAADISDFLFTPNPITLQRGTSVIWTNRDGTQHTVTADDNKFKSKNLNTGDMFAQTLDAPGTYTYHCSIHPFMKGTIVVR